MRADPDHPVLRDVSLTVLPGQKVALVGPSGSGKSTIIQLLQRFYEPASGELLLAGAPLPSYNLAALRAAYGLIQQEPSLFADSIAYNIEYGRVAAKPQWDKGAPLDFPEGHALPAGAGAGPADVAAAAAAANATGFVERFKFGYATHAGSRGNQQLSGGRLGGRTCLRECAPAVRSGGKQRCEVDRRFRVAARRRGVCNPRRQRQRGALRGGALFGHRRGQRELMPQQADVYAAQNEQRRSQQRRQVPGGSGGGNACKAATRHAPLIARGVDGDRSDGHVNAVTTPSRAIAQRGGGASDA
jgi:ABC-type sugar transport system ATPase subunit